ncbi:MAG: hypothetical protein J5825_08490 [Lachnospiraceae bacterium]|nr:hypothetical protein [Lachnospiraceae bacterium]
MNRVLGIYDKDRTYAGKLSERLSERKDLAYMVLPFFEKQELMDYAGEHHLQLLMVGSELADEEVLSLDAERILLLTDEEGTDPDTILRFQSVSSFVRRIREPVSGEPDFRELPKGKVIRGIFSPEAIFKRDRVVREILSSGRSESLPSEKRALLITLASFSELAPEEESDQFDISDAYYFWKQNALEKHLPELIKRGEDFDYIPGVYFPEDLLVISRDRLRVFLRELAQLSGRDQIYIDFAMFGNDVSLISSLCEEQIMPYYEQSESRNKVMRYEKYVTRSGHEDWLSKIVHYPLAEA